MNAVWGSWRVSAELQDLTEDEAKQLLALGLPVIFKLLGVFVPSIGK